MQTRSKAKLEEREQLRDAPPLHLLQLHHHPHLQHLALPQKAPAPAGALCELSKLLDPDALTPSENIARRRSRMATATSTPKGFHLRRLKRFTSSSTLSTIDQLQEEERVSSTNIQTSPSTFLSDTSQDLSSTTSHFLPCLTSLPALAHGKSPIIGKVGTTFTIATTVNTTNNSITKSSNSHPSIAAPPCFTTLAYLDLTTTPRNLSIIAHNASSESNVSSDADSPPSFYLNGRPSSPGKRLRVRSFSPLLHWKSSQERKKLYSHFAFSTQVDSESSCSPGTLSPSLSNQPRWLSFSSWKLVASSYF